MQNTTIVWLSIDLMCNLSFKLFTWKIRYLLGLLFLPFSHIHRHALVMHNPLLSDCLSIWCEIWATKGLQIRHSRVLLFPPMSFAIIKFDYTDLKIQLFKIICTLKSGAKLISWALFLTPNNSKIIKLTNKYIMNRFAICNQSTRVSMSITINMGFICFPHSYENIMHNFTWMHESLQIISHELPSFLVRRSLEVCKMIKNIQF